MGPAAGTARSLAKFPADILHRARPTRHCARPKSALPVAAAAGQPASAQHAAPTPARPAHPGCPWPWLVRCMVTAMQQQTTSPHALSLNCALAAPALFGRLYALQHIMYAPTASCGLGLRLHLLHEGSSITLSRSPKTGEHVTPACHRHGQHLASSSMTPPCPGCLCSDPAAAGNGQLARRAWKTQCLSSSGSSRLSQCCYPGRSLHTAPQTADPATHQLPSPPEEQPAARPLPCPCCRRRACRASACRWPAAPAEPAP
jgi:hypothetical protein